MQPTKVNREIADLIEKYDLFNADSSDLVDNNQFLNDLDTIINNNKKDLRRRAKNQLRKNKIKKINGK